MAAVILSDSDSVEWAIKVFRRQVQKAGILKDVREKRYYMKPSVARRRKAEKARRRVISAQRKRRRK